MTPSSQDELRQQLEKLLLKQARLTLASENKRSANKYEILPELVTLFKEQMLNLIDDSMPQGTYHVNTEALQRKIEEL